MLRLEDDGTPVWMELAVRYMPDFSVIRGFSVKVDDDLIFSDGVMSG
ncbi:hypothetical protein [Geodermatophilus sp. SYSU D01176]